MSTDLKIISAHGPLPVIDLNTFIPQQETVSMKLGDKPENIDLNSVRLADQIIDTLLAGDIDPLEFAVKRRLLVDALEVAFKDKRVKELMSAEIAKYGKGETPTRLGATVTLTDRTSYKYDQSPQWCAASVSIQPYKDKLKELEGLIQTATKTGKSIFDEASGEVVAAAVPTTNTSSVTVSLNKGKKK